MFVTTCKYYYTNCDIAKDMLSIDLCDTVDSVWYVYLSCIYIIFDNWWFV